MKLAYEGFDKTGQAVADVLDASDVADATEKLRRQGLFVTRVLPAEEAAGRRKRHMSRGRQLKNLGMFARQLHVLVATGTPLVPALGALERQTKDQVWHDVVVHLRRQVEEGVSLSEAMGQRGEYFDAIARSLVAAGETGGNLDAMLDRLATLTIKQLHVRSSIIGAMIYPILLIFVAVGVLVTLLTFVLPRFAELFKSLDTALPPTTQIIMTLSDALRGYWWTLPIVAVPGWFVAAAWLRSEPGKRAFDIVALNAPQIGKITRSFATARVTRLLGVLMQGKVPLIKALELTRDAMNNSFYRTLVHDAAESVAKGKSLAAAFDGTALFSQSVVEAIRSGERSGQIGPLLLNISDFLDEENDVVVKSITSIIEPLILIVLGLLVGFVAISMFLPLFDLTAATRGGG